LRKSLDKTGMRWAGGLLLLGWFALGGVAARAQSARFQNVTLLPSPFAPAQEQTQAQAEPQAQAPPRHVLEAYAPISGRERLKWIVVSTVGPKSLGVGVLSAAISTASNTPKEYRPGWTGFGKRYGIRLTGLATNNVIEGGLGALWGEDPRYFPDELGRSFSHRLKHAVILAFTARFRNGDVQPAYARFASTIGGNFLSNTWRADSDAGNGDALRRAGLGFAGRVGSDIFDEFWSDIKQRVFHKGQ
jgi:hypothetical protein